LPDKAWVWFEIGQFSRRGQAERQATAWNVLFREKGTFFVVRRVRVLLKTVFKRAAGPDRLLVENVHKNKMK
jgi:hypothetical protein